MATPKDSGAPLERAHARAGSSSSGGSPSRLSLVDTHAHLCDPAFARDLDAVMERAWRAGVMSVVAVGEGIDDARLTLELARARGGLFPRTLPSVGLSPSNADPALAEEIADLARRERGALCAIGEVGLDFWVAKDEKARDIQTEVFSAFIDLAAELDLPLNVHSRSAGLQTVQHLLRRGAKKVQLHAFDGKTSAALPAVEAGFFFSIPPSVVRSEQKQKLVRSLPLGALLLETDSPVLGPVKEERNEPKNILVALGAVAEIKGIPPEEVVEAAFQNTRALYGGRISRGLDP